MPHRQPPCNPIGAHRHVPPERLGRDRFEPRKKFASFQCSVFRKRERWHNVGEKCRVRSEKGRNETAKARRSQRVAEGGWKEAKRGVAEDAEFGAEKRGRKFASFQCSVFRNRERWHDVGEKCRVRSEKSVTFSVENRYSTGMLDFWKRGWGGHWSIYWRDRLRIFD